jgi:hypothetical protein
LRSTLEEIAPITPGVAMLVRISLGHTHFQFKSGERLRVTLSGGEMTRILPTAPAGIVTLHHGSQTFVEIPVLQ